jgi:hypothetical protein
MGCLASDLLVAPQIRSQHTCSVLTRQSVLLNTLGAHLMVIASHTFLANYTQAVNTI